MRNSSLVEEPCAENVTGLKFAAEAVDAQVQGRRFNSGTGNQKRNLFAGDSAGEWQRGCIGNLELSLGVVEERSSGDEGES